jgi:hypothetical protein
MPSRAKAKEKIVWPDQDSEEESPVEINKRMRVKTLERVQRVAEKVKTISFAPKKLVEE